MSHNEKDINNYYQVKFTIIGDVYVGKTTIAYRYINGEFINKYEMTINPNFLFKNIKVNDKIFLLQLWDTAGSEKYKSLTSSFYKNSTCCIIVYEVNSRKSFESVTNWIEECVNNTNRNIILILVGNKCDLEQKREVKSEEGEAFADRYNIEFFEASAITGYNIDEIFKYGCQKIYENIANNVYDLNCENESCGIKILSSNDNLNCNKKYLFKLKNKKEEKKKKKCKC